MLSTGNIDHSFLTLRMCCTFYLYLPISKSNLTQYLSEVTVYVGPMVYVINLEPLHKSDNRLTKLHHCSYISLLNLQHILSLISPGDEKVTNFMKRIV